MNANEDVLLFLESLKVYLYGDLALFEKLCSEAESIESLQKGSQSKMEDVEALTGGIICDTSNVKPPITSSAVVTTTTTTTETTKSPDHEYVLENRSMIFRSTIPHVLSIFATIDLVGFLLGELNPNVPTTAKNIEMFFKGFTKPSENDVKLLTILFRHGMSHTYFPKKQLGVKAHSSNPENELFFVENDVIVLNVNHLIQLTKNKLESVLKDTSLIANMKKQFQKLINHENSNIAKLGFDFDSFKNSLYKV